MVHECRMVVAAAAAKALATATTDITTAATTTTTNTVAANTYCYYHGTPITIMILCYIMQANRNNTPQMIRTSIDTKPGVARMCHG